MARSTFLAWLLLAASACTGGQTGSEGAVDGPGKGDTPDGGLGHGPSAGGDDCGDAGVDPAVLDWEAASEVGSAAEAFGAAEGSCEADLRWNGAPFDDRTIEPVSGTSALTVELTLDHDSVRWVERSERGGRVQAPCGGYLEVQGHVTLETADGTFRAQSDVTLRRTLDDQSVTYGFDEDVADHEGSLSIQLRDDERGTLTYRIDGSGDACAGTIDLTVSTSRDGVGMAGGGQLAAWSDSACPLGQQAFDLTEPGPDGSTLAETIESTWGEGSYPGTWLDGEQAELTLAVEVPGEDACRERGATGAVEVPVRATYSTSDGRLQERTVDASVRATLDEAGQVRQLDFWLSDEQVCESTSDVLDYQPADCAEVESVTVQVGWNDSRDGVPQVDDGGLNVYFTPRGGGEPPTGDRLEL